MTEYGTEIREDRSEEGVEEREEESAEEREEERERGETVT